MKTKNVVQAVTQTQNFLSLDVDISSLALCTAPGLVNHDACVTQRVTFSRGTCRKQDGTHAGSLSNAICGNIAFDELHRVVNGEASGHRAAGGIDVHTDVFLSIFRLQEKQLRNDQITDVVINTASDKDDAILEKARKNIVGTFATAGLFDHHRDQRVCLFVHDSVSP